MNKIIIVASELSVMTGHKNFNEKDKLKVINLILNRNGIVKKYIPKSKIEEQLLNLSEKDLNCIKKELNIDDKSSLNDIENMIKKQVLSKSLNKNITEDQSKKRMNDVIKSMPTLNKYLEKDIKQDLRMERGNIKENKNLDKTQIKCNIKIDNRNSQIYEEQLYIDPDRRYQIIIRGKCDGMNDEYVVETKNRTRKLFNMIPDYEKVQLNAYMFLVKKEKSLHIENYNENSNEIKYDFDKLFWDDCCNRIIKFINNHIINYL